MEERTTGSESVVKVAYEKGVSDGYKKAQRERVDRCSTCGMTGFTRHSGGVCDNCKDGGDYVVDYDDASYTAGYKACHQHGYENGCKDTIKMQEVGSA